MGSRREEVGLERTVAIVFPKTFLNLVLIQVSGHHSPGRMSFMAVVEKRENDRKRQPGGPLLLVGYDDRVFAAVHHRLFSGTRASRRAGPRLVALSVAKRHIRCMIRHMRGWWSAIRG